MPVRPGSPHFDTTRWSLVAVAAGDDSSAAREALANICEIYWYPIYAYVRRAGHAPEDAHDLTQSFFVLLLERRDIERVRPDRGRLRSYLLTSLQHFLVNQDLHDRAQKRGGRATAIPLEVDIGEHRYAREPADTRTPDILYERQWALAAFERAFTQITAEWRAAGKSDELEHLKDCLVAETPRGGYRELAQQLGRSENALRIAAHRLRRRFQRALRDAVRDTVSSDAMVDDEIRQLLHAIRDAR